MQKFYNLLKFINPLKSSLLLKIDREIDVKNEIKSEIKSETKYDKENEKKGKTA